MLLRLQPNLSESGLGSTLFASALRERTKQMRNVPLYVLWWLLLGFTPIPLQAQPHVVISQIYGGGGNSGATLTNDFVELFNRGNQGATVDGWTLNMRRPAAVHGIACHWRERSHLATTISFSWHAVTEGLAVSRIPMPPEALPWARVRASFLLFGAVLS